MSSNDEGSVQVDGAVLLQLIRHYQEYSSSDRDDISGFLLGVTVGKTLEITNSIPYPSCSDDDQAEGFNFESEYVSKLQNLKLDDVVIGIYQSVSAGDFINRGALENLFQYQYLFNDSILLIYDPALTAQGKIGLRAYRLQPEIFKAFSVHNQKLQIYKNIGDVGQWEHEAANMMNKPNFNRLYVEIPVVIHNSPLIKIMMHDIGDGINVGNNLFFGSDNAPIDSNNPGDIESNLKQLLSSLDAVHDIQYNYHRKLGIIQKSGSNDQKNKDLVTSRLEIALASGQLSYLSNGIAQMAGQIVGKLMLSNAFYTSNQ